MNIEAAAQLVSALRENKGWTTDYATAIVWDAIDRTHLHNNSEWTQEQPTETGFYWMLQDRDGSKYEGLVQYHTSNFLAPPAVYKIADSEYFPINSKKLIGAWWSKITMPPKPNT